MDSLSSNMFGDLLTATFAAVWQFRWLFLAIVLSAILIAIFEREIRFGIAIAALGWLIIQLFGIRQIMAVIVGLAAIVILAMAIAFFGSRLRRPVVKLAAIERPDDKSKPRIG